MLYYKYATRILSSLSLSLSLFLLPLFSSHVLHAHTHSHTFVTTKYDSFSLYLQRYFRCIFKSIIKLSISDLKYFNTNSVFIQYHKKNRPKYWLIFSDISLLLCMMKYTLLSRNSMFTINFEEGNHSVITRMICVRIYIEKVISYCLLELIEMWEDGSYQLSLY